HRIVRRMAKQLATKYNKRRKHTRRGVLDVRRTLRRNMAHGGIPFETIWKQTKIEKPKIVAMCDVSGSVAASARFLLLFLYSLNEVISSLRSYAFSANLIEVSDILEAKTAELAVPEIVEKVGFR
ncbi:MAG: VWA domain-containing protein, partial [Alphaproteobacteria bacterium]